MAARSSSGPLTQVEVESEIRRMSDRAEDITHQMRKRAEAAAKADVAFKVAHAKALLVAEGTVDERKAQAVIACEQELWAQKETEALLDSCKEAGRNCREQMASLRSINVNLRDSIVSASGIGA